MKYFVLIFVFLTTGCATVIRSPLGWDGTLNVGSSKFQKAVEENNSDAVRALFKDKSFIGKALYGDSRNEAFQLQRAYEMLDLVILGSSHESIAHGICRTGIVQTLLDANLPPRAIDLSRAAEIPCPDIVQIIVTKLSAKDIETGTNQFLKFFEDGLSHISRRNQTLSKLNNYLQVLQLLKKVSTEEIRQKIVDAELLLDKNVFKPIQQSQDLTRQIEAQYKMPFCAKDNLLESIYYPGGSIEPNCIYQLKGAPLKVLQVTPQGILVALIQDNPYSMGKVFLIKTNEQYVDDDRVGDMLVKSIGAISYTSVAGGMKTVHAFQYLGKREI